jgi:ribonuclease HI
MKSLYCDGSSTGRSNREWGWGFVLVEGDIVLAHSSGGGPSGSNNSAELTAAIMGFRYMEANGILGPVTIVSDSKYCLGIANGTYTPSKNLELCQELRAFYLKYNASTRWVKGHSGERLNEVVDKLAKAAKDMYKDPGDEYVVIS